MQKPDRIEIDPETFLKQDFALAPLPEVVMNIQKIINSSDANVDNISDLIKRDPVLTAQVLKTVNSAYYGFRNEVSDIKFAVAYLGIHEIFNMVISITTVETLGVDDQTVLENFWDHSIYSALCAKFLAKQFEPLLAPEQIWIGALLHDIGKLVYFKFFPEHIKYITHQTQTSGRLYSEIEKELSIPPSHYIGTLLCARWDLPSMISAACESQAFNLASTGESTINDYKKIIYCANMMAILATEELTNETKQVIFKNMEKALQTSEAELLELMGRIYDLKLEVAKYKW